MQTEDKTSGAPQRGAGFDISKLFRYYLSKWPLFVISVVAFVAMGLVFAYMRQTRVEVQANVLVTDDDKEADLMRVTGLADVLGGGASIDEELTMLSSHTLFRDVAQMHKAHIKYQERKNILKRVYKFYDSPLELITPPAVPDTMRDMLQFKVWVSKGQKVDVKVRNMSENDVIGEVKDASFPVSVHTCYGDFIINKTDSFEPDERLRMSIWLSGYDRAAESLQKEVSCFIPNKKANVMTISYISPSIAYGKNLVNSVVQEYNDRGIERSQKKAQRIADFIDNRLISLMQELNSTEMNLEQYKKKNDITSIEVDAQYMMSKRARLESELMQAQTAVELLKLTRSMLADPDNRYSLIPVPVNSEALSSLIEEYNKAVLERMRLESGAKGDNSMLKSVSERIDAMRQNIFTSLDRTIDAQQLRVREIESESVDSKSRLGKVPTQEREYLNIARQHEIQQQIYLFLLREREQANMRIANALPKGQIIDSAFAMSKTAGMDKKKILMLFFFLGVAAVPAWLYLRKLIRNTFNGAEEVGEATDVKVLGELPFHRAASDGLIMTRATAADDAETERLRLLRTSLQFMTRDKSHAVVLVTSASEGDGKTFVAANLAASFVAIGKRVLVVDMNLRRPRVAPMFGLPSGGDGLSSYLSCGTPEADALVSKDAGGTGVDVIAAGTVPPNPSELLASPRLPELIEALAPGYDYVLLDCAPTEGMADALMGVPVADAVLYVVRARKTTEAELVKLNRLVADGSLPRASIVVNAVRPPRKIFGVAI